MSIITGARYGLNSALPEVKIIFSERIYAYKTCTNPRYKHTRYKHTFVIGIRIVVPYSALLPRSRYLLFLTWTRGNQGTLGSAGIHIYAYNGGHFKLYTSLPLEKTKHWIPGHARLLKNVTGVFNLCYCNESSLLSILRVHT